MNKRTYVMAVYAHHSSRPRIGATALLLASGVAVAVLLAGCSGGSSPRPSPAGGSPAPSRPGAGGGAGRGGPPATSGTIAEVAADTIEVQDQATGQVTVKYTAKTSFTQTQATTLSDVRAGTCVLASAMPNRRGSTSSAPADPTSTTSFTAATVVISKAVNGKCTVAGFGGVARPNGTRSPRSGDQFPSGVPSGARRSGAPGDGFAFAARAAGTVRSVSASTITVSGTTFRTSPAVTYTVKVDASTKFSQIVAATAKALAVGQCATAIGPADDTGAVTATSIRISAPTNGSCSVRFGGRRQPGGPSTTNG